LSYSLQELSDKFEITENLYKYAKALDDKDAELLKREVFVEDAVWEGRVGSIKGAGEVGEMAITILGAMESTEHIIADPLIWLDGDRATSQCYLHSILFYPDQRTGDPILELGAAYYDKHVRTDEGWRIEHRRLEVKWLKGNHGVETESLRMMAEKQDGKLNEYAARRLTDPGHAGKK
jgi:SnoaL-like domain